jgi:hypothetical protein
MRDVDAGWDCVLTPEDERSLAPAFLVARAPVRPIPAQHGHATGPIRRRAPRCSIRNLSCSQWATATSEGGPYPNNIVVASPMDVVGVDRDWRPLRLRHYWAGSFNITGGQFQHPAALGNVDVARNVHRHTFGAFEVGERQHGWGAGAGGQLVHPVVGVVGDVEVARGVHRHTPGFFEVNERQHNGYREGLPPANGLDEHCGQRGQDPGA